MPATEYTLDVKRFDPADPRLGRHVRHDSRSLRFLVTPQPRSAMVSVRHYSHIPVLDQGNLGSCTGNASTKNMSYGDFWVAQGDRVLSQTETDVNQTYAVGVYSDATKLDPWDGTYLPDDTGSDGLSVAKVLQSRGLISGYKHATSLDAVLTALQTQPVITGTTWNEDMFEPDADGRLHITGDPQGGHEYVLDEVDMENERIWMQNSWGPYWGIEGRAYFTFDDYATLLADYGDVTIFVPITEPAPEPTPQPTPEPVPVPDDDADATFAAEAKKWLSGCPFFYKSMQRATKAWLERKNL